MVKIEKMAHQNTSIPSKQERFINNVNQYEKALLSNRNLKKMSNSQIGTVVNIK